ncbi:MAG: type II toxin-antitoxin system VapC family toxin [Deltaproteobacteria bacterium]|nr:type II toxin-antitoxin system VapC family toxin [Deltaproteobacteria bacterium]
MTLSPCFVDTNVFVRYLTADDAKKAKAVEKLLIRAGKGEIRLVTSPIVIAELVWVLESFYKLDRADIAELLEAILNTIGLKVDNSETVITALAIYQNDSIDYVDAYIIAHLRLREISTLYSYDKKHLSIFSDIKRVEP